MERLCEANFEATRPLEECREISTPFARCPDGGESVAGCRCRSIYRYRECRDLCHKSFLWHSDATAVMRMIGHIRGRMANMFDRHTGETRRSENRAPEFALPFFRHIIESSPTPILVIEAGATTQTIVYANPIFERLFDYGRDEILGRDWRVFLSVPGPEGRAQALQASMRAGAMVEETLVAFRKDGRLLYFNTRLSPVCDDAGIIVQHVAVLHDVTSERRARAALERRACYDPLTGLANRYLLRDRFEHVAAQAQRHGSVHALTLLDLDEFKQVNDRFGHAAGDEALIFLSARLTDLVRGEDTVARLGGDEFVLILMDADPDSIGLIVRRLGESLASFAPSGLGPLGLSFSAGVAYCPVDGMTLERLLQAADKRLYAAKAGRARFLGNGLSAVGRNEAPRWIAEWAARG